MVKVRGVIRWVATLSYKPGNSTNTEFLKMLALPRIVVASFLWQHANKII